MGDHAWAKGDRCRRLAFSAAQSRSEPRSAYRSEPWIPLGAATGVPRYRCGAGWARGDRWLWELGSSLADGMGGQNHFDEPSKPHTGFMENLRGAGAWVIGAGAGLRLKDQRRVLSAVSECHA